MFQGAEERRKRRKPPVHVLRPILHVHFGRLTIAKKQRKVTGWKRTRYKGGHNGKGDAETSPDRDSSQAGRALRLNLSRTRGTIALAKRGRVREVPGTTSGVRQCPWDADRDRAEDMAQPGTRVGVGISFISFPPPSSRGKREDGWPVGQRLWGHLRRSQPGRGVVRTCSRKKEGQKQGSGELLYPRLCCGRVISACLRTYIGEELYSLDRTEHVGFEREGRRACGCRIGDLGQPSDVAAGFLHSSRRRIRSY